ncbi:MAG TPA: cell division protein ZapE [Steroidobacteraceae bacterium]|nr:cell division protein ZapE [Steroidobacteraceae bacterium]
MADLQQITPDQAHATLGGSALLRLAYGLYAWTMFIVLGAAAVPVLLLTPKLSQRRALVRALARNALRLIGMRVRVSGLDRVQTPCVVVANHTSYLDGVVLAGVLPSSFGFVIKREMSSVPLAGTLLRRIGAEFVERQDRRRGARDARRLLRQAAHGQALVFFPEGTFSAEIGLLRFHMGAFTAASRADLTVFPVAIRGTRERLAPGHLLPRPGSIEVEVLPAVARSAQAGTGVADRATALRNAARAALLTALGEPDLAVRESTSVPIQVSAPKRVRAAGPTLQQRYERESRAHGYDPDSAQRAALERLEALRVRQTQRNHGGLWQRLLRPWRAEAAAPGRRGIYLHGGVGRGKTMLMDLFYDSLPLSQRQRSHFHHFMREVHEQLGQLRARRAPLHALARELAARSRVLCLDELYVSDIADAMILGGLFESLLRRDVLLVITSNFAPQELYRGGLQRARFLPTIALLERELEQCWLGRGTDYRLRQLQRAPIYLDSHEPDSNARLQQLFAEMGTTVAGFRTEVRILGRTIRAVRCLADLVWFEFDEICAGARSQIDYVELAQEFRTVMLSNVPVFSAPEQDDAARRFIALVDEFYDQGTKLILSAAAQPFELYRGGRLQVEFQRTMSRLVEMQTASYLARPPRG